MDDSNFIVFTEPLYTEIDCLKETLLVVDNDNTISMDNAQQLIGEHREKISVVLATYSRKDCNLKPIHRLLSIRPLTRVEIPLDILELLIAFGFNVNQFDYDDKPCLQISITNRHYTAVRWLIDHGADCNLRDDTLYREENGRHFDVKTPIALLATYPNVPLDLFDLLKTSENLNDSSYEHLPLHTAIANGHTESALHLVKLGADVTQRDGMLQLPIQYYLEKYIYEYHGKLFTSLLPSCNLDLLCIACKILKEEKVTRDYTVMSKMLQQLLQRIIILEPLTVKVQVQEDEMSSVWISVDMRINQKYVMRYQETFQGVYICSLLLSRLDCAISTVPDPIVPFLPSSSPKKILAHAQAVDDIWETYQKKHGTRSLLCLCIRQIRHSLNSLSDSSFLTLPVPSSIRKLLMYHDLAEVIHEEWCVWVPYLPILHSSNI